MACRKCGSSWTTIYGADTATCPACCKQARCRARKLGRLNDDSPEPRECIGCGVVFHVVTPSEKAKKKFCSDSCHAKTRAARARECRNLTDKKQTPKTVKQERVTKHCLVCSKKLGKCQRKYCGNQCFVLARKTGIQQWDRSNSIAAARNRPSNVSESPWRYVPRECVSNISAFLHNIRKIYRPVRCPVQLFDCVICGRLCLNGSRTHCSKGCGSRVIVVAECHACGGNFTRNSESKKTKCRKCVRRAKRKNRNRLAGNHRKRCRKNGVPFDPSIKSRDVFARDNYVCHVCKRKVLPAFTVRGGVVHPRSPTVDHHPYPLSAGIMGHTWDNVRCACWDCNTKKGAEWSGQLPLRLDATGPP